MNKYVMAALAAAAISQVAAAQTYGFDCVTNSSAVNCAAGEAQLSVTVSGPSATQALFTFTNAGSATLSLTDVYFEDGSLLGIAAITNGLGVSFSQFASPGNLPGGNTIGFTTTAGFSADSNPPVQPSGVNPGETLGILFDLQAGRSFADVNSDLASGELRIGIHAQGYSNGGSESLVNLASPVPEAPAALYLLSSMGVVAWFGRVRRRSAAGLALPR